MVTHDLGQAERLAQQIFFLHQGRLVESDPAAQVLLSPHHEITRLFINRGLVV